MPSGTGFQNKVGFLVVFHRSYTLFIHIDKKKSKLVRYCFILLISMTIPIAWVVTSGKIPLTSIQLDLIFKKNKNKKIKIPVLTYKSISSSPLQGGSGRHAGIRRVGQAK